MARETLQIWIVTGAGLLQQTAPAAPDSAWKAPRGRLRENVHAKLRSRLPTPRKPETDSTKGTNDGHLRWNLV
jgi:hypothetical protein